MERLGELLLRIKQFNEEREWEQFHTPSNLAKSISIEANELLEDGTGKIYSYCT